MARFASDDTVLLAIDFQRAFCARDGSVARQGRDIATCVAAAERAYDLIGTARAAGLPVIWTRMAYRPDYSDGGILVHDLRPGMKTAGSLRDGTPDAELMPDAPVETEDIVIDKNRYSAFIGTNLDSVLRDLGARNILVTGVTTSMCVETTVREASQRDYMPYVVPEACADFAPGRHEASLAALEFGFARMLPFDDALAVLSAASAALPPTDAAQ